MSFDWKAFYQIMCGQVGKVDQESTTGTVQIQYLDVTGAGTWKNAGSAIKNGPIISQRMQDVAKMKTGRRVRAIDSDTNMIVDIFN